MPVVVTTTEGGTTATKASGMDIPVGKTAVSFENLGPVDTIVDVIGTTPPIDAELIIPNAKKMFVLAPGSYKFNAGSPGGTYSTSGEFALKAGQWAEVVIFGDKNQTNVRDSMMMESTSTPTPTMESTSTPTPTMESTSTPTPTMESTSTPTPTVESASTPTPTMKSSMAPTAGKARVYLQNMYTDEYNIDFGDGSGIQKVAPSVKDLYVELAPGAYKPGLSLPGGAGLNLDLNLAADQSWIILVTEGRQVGAVQVYP